MRQAPLGPPLEGLISQSILCNSALAWAYRTTTSVSFPSSQKARPIEVGQITNSPAEAKQAPNVARGCLIRSIPPLGSVRNPILWTFMLVILSCRGNRWHTLSGAIALVSLFSVCLRAIIHLLGQPGDLFLRSLLPLPSPFGGAATSKDASSHAFRGPSLGQGEA